MSVSFSFSSPIRRLQFVTVTRKETKLVQTSTVTTASRAGFLIQSISVLVPLIGTCFVVKIVASSLKNTFKHSSPPPLPPSISLSCTAFLSGERIGKGTWAACGLGVGGASLIMMDGGGAAHAAVSCKFHTILHKFAHQHQLTHTAHLSSSLSVLIHRTDERYGCPCVARRRIGTRRVRLLRVRHGASHETRKDAGRRTAGRRPSDVHGGLLVRMGCMGCRTSDTSWQVPADAVAWMG